MGNPGESEIRNLCLKNLQQAEIDPDHIEEANWNVAVVHPGERILGSEKVLDSILSGLGHGESQPEGIVGSSYLGLLSQAAYNSALLPCAWNGTGKVDGLKQAFLYLTEAATKLLLAAPALCAAAGGVWIGGKLSGNDFYQITGLIFLEIIVLGGLGILLAGLTFNPQQFWPVLRRTALSCGWPFIYAVFALTNLRYLYLIPIICAFLSLSLLSFDNYYKVDSTAIGPIHRISSFVQVKGAFTMFLAAAVAMIPALAVRAGLKMVLNPLLKIVSDVVMYLGLAEHRRTLYRVVDAKARRLEERGCDHIVFVTHSLGTVVAIDYLRKACTINSPRISLVTSGSPLRRWFHRFFPLQYPSPDQLMDEAKLRFKAFEWINVYRPRDPVGGSLELADHRDCNTGQNHSILKAHPDYWSDDAVYECAKKGFNKLTASLSGLKGHHKSGASQNQADYDVENLQPFRNWMGHLLGMFAIVTAAYTLLSPIYSRPGQAAKDWEDLMRDGVETNGIVRYFIRQEMVDHEKSRNRTVLVLDFKSSDGRRVSIETGGWLADYDTLEKRFETVGRSAPQEPVKGGDVYTVDGTDLRMDMPIRYLPANPRVAVVKGYERAEKPRSGPVGYILMSIFAMLQLAGGLLVLTALWALVIAPIFSPFLGMSKELDWVPIAMLAPMGLIFVAALATQGRESETKSKEG